MELRRQVQRQPTAMALLKHQLKHQLMAKQGRQPIRQQVDQLVSPRSKLLRGKHLLPRKGGKHRDKRRQEPQGLQLLIRLLARPLQRVLLCRRSSLCQFEEPTWSFEHARFALKLLSVNGASLRSRQEFSVYTTTVSSSRFCLVMHSLWQAHGWSRFQWTDFTCVLRQYSVPQG